MSIEKIEKIGRKRYSSSPRRSKRSMTQVQFETSHNFKMKRSSNNLMSSDFDRKFRGEADQNQINLGRTFLQGRPTILIKRAFGCQNK